MTCPLCSCLIIDYTKLVNERIPLPFEILEEFPGLPKLTRNAVDGCELCRFLMQLISEYFDSAESDSPRPLQFRLTNASFGLISTERGIEDNEWKESAHNPVCELSLDLVYDKPPKTRELYFFVHSDTGVVFNPEQYPMRRCLPQPVEESPTSPITIAKLRKWITDCIETHPYCAIENQSFVPTRLLSVKDGLSLEHTRAGDAAVVPYLALSHCWGCEIVDKPMLRTTISTLEERSIDIPGTILPKNFQDAVTITRALGFEYLWIDALCIVQDCTKDWEREASQMADIYKYATVTIVPTSAKSCHDGFLHSRHFREARIPYLRPHDRRADGLILLRVDDNKPHWEEDVNRSLWRYRGWTLQEWLLSRRTLHFTAQRIYMECKDPYEVKTEGDEFPGGIPLICDFDPEDWGDSASEDANSTGGYDLENEVGPDGEITSGDNEQLSSDTFSSSSEIDMALVTDSDLEQRCPYRVFMWWYYAMNDYTQRSLTYEDDKFPATEGLAREIWTKCSRQVGRYFAGIWEKDLALGLLWKPVHDWTISVSTVPCSWPPKGPSSSYHERAVEIKVPVKCPDRYRAPSWSWASLNGKIVWGGSPQQGTAINTPWLTSTYLTEGVIELLDVNLQHEGKSVYGRLKDGHLTLSAVCEEIYVSSPLPATRGDIRSRLSRYISHDTFDYIVHDEFGKFAVASFDLRSCPQARLYALKLTHPRPGMVKHGVLSGLILQESVRRPGTYQRVGVFVILEEACHRAFENKKPRPITLV